MDAKLVVAGGKATTQEIALKLPAIVGRARESGVRILHPSVSRRHCEIYEVEGALVVRDFGSTNGTLVGDERIEEAVLKPGETLTVGPLTFKAVYEHDGDYPKVGRARKPAATATEVTESFFNKPLPADFGEPAANGASVVEAALSDPTVESHMAGGLPTEPDVEEMFFEPEAPAPAVEEPAAEQVEPVEEVSFDEAEPVAEMEPAAEAAPSAEEFDPFAELEAAPEPAPAEEEFNPFAELEAPAEPEPVVEFDPLAELEASPEPEPVAEFEPLAEPEAVAEPPEEHEPVAEPAELDFLAVEEAPAPEPTVEPEPAAEAAFPIAAEPAREPEPVAFSPDDFLQSLEAEQPAAAEPEQLAWPAAEEAAEAPVAAEEQAAAPFVDEPIEDLPVTEEPIIALEPAPADEPAELDFVAAEAPSEREPTAAPVADDELFQEQLAAEEPAAWDFLQESTDEQAEAAEEAASAEAAPEFAVVEEASEPLDAELPNEPSPEEAEAIAFDEPAIAETAEVETAEPEMPVFTAQDAEEPSETPAEEFNPFAPLVEDKQQAELEATAFFEETGLNEPEPAAASAELDATMFFDEASPAGAVDDGSDSLSPFDAATAEESPAAEFNPEEALSFEEAEPAAEEGFAVQEPGEAAEEVLSFGESSGAAEPAEAPAATDDAGFTLTPEAPRAIPDSARVLAARAAPAPVEKPKKRSWWPFGRKKKAAPAAEPAPIAATATVAGQPIAAMPTIPLDDAPPLQSAVSFEDGGVGTVEAASAAAEAIGFDMAASVPELAPDDDAVESAFVAAQPPARVRSPVGDGPSGELDTLDVMFPPIETVPPVSETAQTADEPPVADEFAAAEATAPQETVPETEPEPWGFGEAATEPEAEIPTLEEADDFFGAEQEEQHEPSILDFVDEDASAEAPPVEDVPSLAWGDEPEEEVDHSSLFGELEPAAEPEGLDFVDVPEAAEEPPPQAAEADMFSFEEMVSEVEEAAPPIEEQHEAPELHEPVDDTDQAPPAEAEAAEQPAAEDDDLANFLRDLGSN